MKLTSLALSLVIGSCTALSLHAAPASKTVPYARGSHSLSSGYEQPATPAVGTTLSPAQPYQRGVRPTVAIAANPAPRSPCTRMVVNNPAHRFSTTVACDPANSEACRIHCGL